MSERYKLYNYAMPEYETLIIDTKTNNFVKYSKLLEIINHTDISEFVNSLEGLISKVENIDRNDVRRAYVDVYWIVKLKREMGERLPDATDREKRAK